MDQDNYQRPEVRLADETITYLRQQMKEAVRDGIAEALTEEAAKQFWSTGVNVLREQAAVQTGRFVIEGFWALAKRAFWVALFVLAVYTLGGWALVKTVWQAIVKGAP